MQSINRLSNSSSKTGRLPRPGVGLTWLIVLPAGIWGILDYYLPVLGGTLSRAGTWIVTAGILGLAALSLACHILAHWGAARLAGEKPPAQLTLLIFGDATQTWPGAAGGAREFLTAAAGPLVNLLLAGLAYLVWAGAANNSINLIALFLCGFNIWMFVINLIPVFPFDGGRIFRLSLRGLVFPVVTRRFQLYGLVLAAILTGWGVFLVLQNSRFSWETGLITGLFVLLILDGLRFQPAMEESSRPEAPEPRVKYRFIRSLAAGLLCLVMLAAASALALTNNGLDAPGVALSVGPMIKLPAQYQHAFKGQFYLVTVISQAPITAGEWLAGKVSPTLQIVPPEQVTPKNTTPQQQAKQDYQMLDTSETTAIAVGLRLAGYNSALVGKGVQVDAIVPGSHANGVLHIGDIIVGLNGNPIQTTTDLINGISSQPAAATVHLLIKRAGTEISLDIPLMPPAAPGGTPKLGIQIETAGFNYNPPFPVSIETNKISGGPSAGLIFTLTVYNSLISQDLTGGRRIAGTGTINLDGSVGPIGGVKQKIFAAEAVGATYFLCPVDNYADAVLVARTIKVVKIATVQQAVDFLRSLPPQ
ncbi:MAG: S16 family serine protease [Anaerolineales bacterium]